VPIHNLLFIKWVPVAKALPGLPVPIHNLLFIKWVPVAKALPGLPVAKALPGVPGGWVGGWVLGGRNGNKMWVGTGRKKWKQGFPWAIATMSGGARMGLAAGIAKCGWVLGGRNENKAFPGPLQLCQEGARMGLAAGIGRNGNKIRVSRGRAWVGMGRKKGKLRVSMGMETKMWVGGYGEEERKTKGQHGNGNKNVGGWVWGGRKETKSGCKGCEWVGIGRKKGKIRVSRGRGGEPFTGREATTPSIIRKIEKVQGGRRCHEVAASSFPKMCP